MKTRKKTLSVAALTLVGVITFNLVSSSLNLTKSNSLVGLAETKTKSIFTSQTRGEMILTPAVLAGYALVALAETTYVVAAAGVVALVGQLHSGSSMISEAQLD